jgi:hypothetical protein
VIDSFQVLRILSVMHSNAQQFSTTSAQRQRLQPGDHDVHIGSISFWVCAVELDTTHLKEPLAVGDIVSLSRGPPCSCFLPAGRQFYQLEEEERRRNILQSYCKQSEKL